MKDNNENKLSEQDMKENHATDQEKRRKAVKNILMAGGSAITAGQLSSAEWTKPVIESVVLPAHAATSTIGFSISDPVSLSYICTSDDVIIDITGYINQPIAGINVRLELSWSGPNPTMNTPPNTTINVVTDANGNYASLTNNIGYGVDYAEVIASLPDFPDAGTDTDDIDISSNPASPYYCALPEEE